MTIRMHADAFQSELRSFIASIPQESAAPVTRAVALTALRKLISKTPVDTGHARANWQVTLDVPAFGTVFKTDKLAQRAPLLEGSSEVSGSAAFKNGSRVINRAPPYSRILITNNVDYIDVLEDGRIDGGGFDPIETPFGEVLSPKRSRARGSIQAPHGMLGVTFAELVAGFEPMEDAAA